MGRFHATCETFWLSIWSCLIIFMIIIYDLFSFENACRSLAHMSLLTIHNIWLQQFGKNVKCLFTTTFDDYVKVFKQSASYNVYLNGGRCGEGPIRDELELWQVNMVTCQKWPTPSLNTPAGPPSLLGYFIWRVKELLDPHNGGLT